MILSLQRVRLPLAHFELDMSFEAQAGATGIFGPSGAGKTTVLELIAGIRRPTSGRIVIDHSAVDDVGAGTHVRPRDRQVGYVPQGESLFPHMTVERNIRFGVRGDDAEPFVQRVVDVLEITPLLPRGASALSGGEAKRVALARALVTSPRLLLLDEPLAGLDRPLHSRVIEFLIRVRDDLRVPMIYVTHDPAELRQLVFDVIAIDRGNVVGHGPVTEVLA
ncbi:MAG: molybdenum ABC transporter ATP-binding protein [Acidobacteria bacterium]|nr:MAG: molybdenum ABC transporter ATP-binding protein [Acidobacteriota bacterium]